MSHFTTPQFWQLYKALPPEVRALADKSFALLKADPGHSSLRFKPVGRYWSEGLVWFWIGPHTVYDALTRQA